MASTTTPKLPREIIFRVIHHFSNEYHDWDILRQYLHLRLVSSWFGSYFERAMFRDIRVYIGLSPSSSSNHLLKLVQANAHLAAQVKHLFASDVYAYEGCLEAVSTSGEDTGAPPQLARLEQFREAARQAQGILLSLTAMCTRLKSIHVSNALGNRDQQPYSPFSGAMSHLQMITLSSGAVSNCFHAVVRGLSCNTSLMLIPALRQTESALTLSLRLALEANHPPVLFKALFILEAPYTFLWSFLAQTALRPRSLAIEVSSDDGLRKLVDILVAAPIMTTLVAFFIQVTADALHRPESVISPSDARLELRRLEAASTVGLQAAII